MLAVLCGCTKHYGTVIMELETTFPGIFTMTNKNVIFFHSYRKRSCTYSFSDEERKPFTGMCNVVDF